MQFNASRGGKKPRMLSAGVDWTLDTGGGFEKRGIYEFDAARGALARRVELPHWLALARAKMPPQAFREALAVGSLKPPAEEIGESRGHIWLLPDALLGWTGSALGIDEPIFERFKRLGEGAKVIRFVGYDPGYKLAFQWHIPGADFMMRAKRVQTKPSFMPQWMVPISDLALLVAR